MSNITQSELAVVTLSLALLLFGCGKVVAKADETATPGRKNIELTVYKEDFGVVKEDRSINLVEGRNRVGLLDVSKALDQESVIFNWPKAAPKTEVVSNTYDLGIGEHTSLLKRFLGRPVDLVRYGQDGKESERQHGILEVADPGDIVINVGGKYVIDPQGNIEAPDTGIVTIPQLSAEVDSPSKQSTDLDMTYLTRGLSWNADYVATLDPNSDHINLQVWASITNQTGTDFPNAKISFVAGSPNRAVADHRTRADGDFTIGTRSKTPYPASAGLITVPAAPTATGELYEYPRTANASIAQNQSNRVRMLAADKVAVHKDYSVRLPGLSSYGIYGYGYDNANPDQRYSATVAISFKNTEQNGLGVPLPEGAVRVYEPNSGGSLKYTGAAEIPDTPQKAGVYLTLSNVFDVYGQCRVAKRQRVAKRTVNEDVEIPLHNQKASPVELRVVQAFDGNGRIIAESEKSKKLDAQDNQWTVHLGPGEDRILRITAQFKG